MAEKIPASVDEAFPTCVNFWAHVVPAISRLYIGSRREIHRARGFEARDTTDREVCATLVAAPPLARQ